MIDEKREYLVIVRGPGCACEVIDLHLQSIYSETFGDERCDLCKQADRGTTNCPHSSTVREATRGDLASALLDAADLEADAQAVAHLSVWFQDQADAILSCERMRSDEKRFLDGTADLLRGVAAKLEAARTIKGGHE